MAKGFVCIAGVNLNTMEHIRPVLQSSRLSSAVLARNGGPFDIAEMVDIGSAVAAGSNPEAEDYHFNLNAARKIRKMQDDKFWDLLSRLAKSCLSEIFGDDLKEIGNWSCGVARGKGSASLGCLSIDSPPELYVRPRMGKPSQIRMKLCDDRFDLDLSVTDIRLYGDDHVTPDTNKVNRVASRLEKQVPTILSVGLTRAVSNSPDLPAVHWLQVNNVHLKDDPTWQLG